MHTPSDQDQLQKNVFLITSALQSGALDRVRSMLAGLHPGEAADLLEALPQVARDAVWDQLSPEVHTRVLAQAEDSVRAQRMRHMDTGALAEAARDLDADDATDVLQDLPEAVIEEVLRAMDAQHRARLEALLAYPEDTAGGLMSVDVPTVRGDVSLDVVLRYLRLRGEIPEVSDGLFVVDRDNRYQGVLSFGRLLTSPPGSIVEAVMDTERAAIPADTDEADVARLFEQRDLVSAAVVDDAGRLLGRITVDDVLDVIRDEGEHSLMSMAGLDEEDDMFAPVLDTVRRRSVWLGINLCAALLASWVIGLFENSIEQLVALAVLMPVVASMGGVGGSQVLTIMVRGIALGQVGTANVRRLLGKELAVAVVNGLIWAVALSLVALYRFDSMPLAVVVAGALVVNLLVAGLIGTVAPVVLKRLAIDPALAGGVVVTTVTDVFGFFVFLGLATLVLLA